MRLILSQLLLILYSSYRGVVSITFGLYFGQKTVYRELTGLVAPHFLDCILSQSRNYQKNVAGGNEC